MAITLKQLGYFVALAEARSFKIAAARVHISQPALSLQIKELETLLGVELVERLPRDIRLTRAGQSILDRARVVLSDIRDLEHSAQLQGGLVGRLTLGVIPTVAPYLLPQALSRIRARDLHLDIRVREAQTAVLVAELQDGLLDAALISLPMAQKGLVVEPLVKDRFLLAGSPDRLAALNSPLRPDQVPPDQLLLLDEGHCLADQALEVCGLSARPRGVDLGASSLTTLSGLVAEGFGLTFLPEIAIRTETAAANGLQLMRFTWPEPARVLGLARRASRGDERWAADLAAILCEAGAELISHARAAGRF